MFLFLAITLSYFLLKVNALPISNTNPMQTLLYQQNSRPFTVMNDVEQNRYISQEYDIYSSIVDYYENLVDSTLNSESEELLLNLIHLPKESMKLALTSQAALLGFDTLAEKQLIKMPSIIGKHIQAMNTKVFNSIEPTIKRFWLTIWDPKLLSLEDQGEEHVMSFLSSFNGVMAKRLMDQMDDYNLLENIRNELISIGALEIEEEQLQKGCNEMSWIQWCFFKLLPSKLAAAKLTKTSIADLETDFLRQHLSDVRTSLLMELHIQFMDFYVRIQADIIDTLSFYYNDEY